MTPDTRSARAVIRRRLDDLVAHLRAELPEDTAELYDPKRPAWPQLHEGTLTVGDAFEALRLHDDALVAELAAVAEWLADAFAADAVTCAANLPWPSWPTGAPREGETHTAASALLYLRRGATKEPALANDGAWPVRPMVTPAEVIDACATTMDRLLPGAPRPDDGRELRSMTREHLAKLGDRGAQLACMARPELATGDGDAELFAAGEAAALAYLEAMWREAHPPAGERLRRDLARDPPFHSLWVVQADDGRRIEVSWDVLAAVTVARLARDDGDELIRRSLEAWATSNPAPGHFLIAASALAGKANAGDARLALAGALHAELYALALEAAGGDVLELAAARLRATGDTGRKRADKWATAGELQPWRLWRMGEPKAGFAVYLARALWHDRVKAAAHRNVARMQGDALQSLLATAEAPRQLSIFDPPGGRPGLAIGKTAGRPLALMYERNPVLFEMLRGNLDKGKAPLALATDGDGPQLLLWIAATVQRQKLEGVDRWHRIVLQGGKRALAQEAGLSTDGRKKLPLYFRELSHWHWPIQGISNAPVLASCSEITGGGIVIEATFLLTGEFGDVIKEAGGRVPDALREQVPMPASLPVDSLRKAPPHYRGRLGMLALQIAVALWDRRDEMSERGHVDLWNALPVLLERAGFRTAKHKRDATAIVQRRWTVLLQPKKGEAPDPCPLLKEIAPGRVAYADNHAAVQDWLVEGGRRTLAGRGNAAKREAKREQGRRRGLRDKGA